MRGLLVWLLVLVWAGLVYYGFHAYVEMVPTGDGFTRGLNRATEFLKWEALALGVAIVAWFVVQASASRFSAVSRWAGRAPLILSGGFFVLVLAAFTIFMIYSSVLG